jgi:hypothetical protein
VQDIDPPGSTARRVTPEGISGSLVSPDGKWVLTTDAHRQRWLYPITGGEPQKLNLDIRPDETVLSFFDNGKSLLLRTRALPLEITRVDLATGKREPFKEINPADPAGAQSIPSIKFSADGKSYAYSIGRQLSDLYVVDGLK